VATELVIKYPLAGVGYMDDSKMEDSVLLIDIARLKANADYHEIR